MRNFNSKPEAGSPPIEQGLQPAAATDRITAVDTLRGFAVLGILLINIYMYSMPLAALSNPLAYGGATGINFGIWVFNHVFVEQSFLTIFSTLFGAGLVIMAERGAQRGVRFAGIHYRRMLWLLVIGAAHAYLIWFGDILFGYAVCGACAYPLRRLAPRFLIAIGGVLLLVPFYFSAKTGHELQSMTETVEAIEARRAAGETPTQEQEETVESWRMIKTFYYPTEQSMTRIIQIFDSSTYEHIFRSRINLVFALQTSVFFEAGFWRFGGLMILGMALMKLGILSAARSVGFYRRWTVSFYVFGLPLVAYSAYSQIVHRFDAVYTYKFGYYFSDIGSTLVGLGHAGAVLMACKSAFLARLQTRLAAVGRMALTNYLMHSLLLTTLFYGYGFGLYGKVDRLGQMGIVVLVWLLQILWSPVWLRHFRFGPFEWLWRSLTYWRWQPIRTENS